MDSLDEEEIIIEHKESDSTEQGTTDNTEFHGITYGSPLNQSAHNGEQKGEECFSDFGDSECGEPLMPQHVIIDFTPNDGDTDSITEKCCAFWDFIESHPELKSLKVYPDKDIFIPELTSPVVESGESTVASSPSSTSPLKPESKTALSVLEYAIEREMLVGALDLKECEGYCSDKQGLEGLGEQNLDSFYQLPAMHTSKIASVPKEKKHRQKKAATNVKALCKTLSDWGKLHPKSMESPINTRLLMKEPPSK